jgi:hypothetical protein
VRGLGWLVLVVAIALAVLWLGTFVHEGAHALVATALGARVERINVLGIDLYPALRVNPVPGSFGRVWYDYWLPVPQSFYASAAGSLGTLAVALLAQALFWAVPPRRTWSRLVVTGFCFSWLDIFYHSWPALVDERSLAHAEAYWALVALGAPRWLLNMAIAGLSVALLVLTGVRWWRLVRREGTITMGGSV